MKYNKLALSIATASLLASFANAKIELNDTKGSIASSLHKQSGNSTSATITQLNKSSSSSSSSSVTNDYVFYKASTSDSATTHATITFGKMNITTVFNTPAFNTDGLIANGTNWAVLQNKKSNESPDSIDGTLTVINNANITTGPMTGFSMVGLKDFNIINMATLAPTGVAITVGTKHSSSTTAHQSHTVAESLAIKNGQIMNLGSLTTTWIHNGNSIDKIDNMGTMSGQKGEAAIGVAGTVTYISNKDSEEGQQTGSIGQGQSASTYVRSYLIGSTNSTNDGDNTNAGIKVHSSGHIGTIENGSTIATGHNDLKSAGIIIAGSVGTIINKEKALIKSYGDGTLTSGTGDLADYGLLLENSTSSLDKLDNKGTIEGYQSGLMVNGTINDISTSGTISSTNASAIDIAQGAKVISLNLSGGTISSTNASAITNAGYINALSIEKETKLSSKADAKDIVNNNLISSLTNKGTIKIDSTKGMIPKITTEVEANTSISALKLNELGVSFDTKEGGIVSLEEGALKISTSDFLVANKTLDEYINLNGSNIKVGEKDYSSANLAEAKVISVDGVTKSNISELKDSLDQLGLVLQGKAAKSISNSLNAMLNTRNIFVDNVMDNAIINQNAVYNTYAYNNNLKKASLKSDYNDNSDYRYSNFILPYYNGTSVDLSDIENKLESSSHTRGFIAGGHYFSDYGIWGVYLGYEDTDYKTNSVSVPMDMNIKSIYGGLRYNNFIHEIDDIKLYVKAHLKFASHDLNGNVSLIGSSMSANATLDTRSSHIGGEVGVGALLRPYESTLIKPQLSLSYDNNNLQAYNLNFTNNAKAYFDALNSNFFGLKASVKADQKLIDNVNLIAEVGAKYILNPTLDSKITTKTAINDNGTNSVFNQSYDIDSIYGFAQVGVAFKVSDDASLSLNYNGLYSSGVASNTGFIQVEWLW